VTFVLVVFAIAFAYAFIRGKGKILSAIISFYPALILFTWFPYWSMKVFEKQGIHSFFAHLGVFLLMYIPTHLILSRAIESYYSETKFGKIFQISSLSSAFLILTALTSRFLPALYTFSFNEFITRHIFWFLVAPILLVLISVRD
jgi:hypothetical protein